MEVVREVGGGSRIGQARSLKWMGGDGASGGTRSMTRYRLACALAFPI